MLVGKRYFFTRLIVLLTAVFILLLTATIIYWNATKFQLSWTHCVRNPIRYADARAHAGNSSLLRCGTPCTAYSQKFQVLSEILESYRQYHKKQRKRKAELSEGQPIKTLTWYCLSDCNGIGDRMRGMYASFLLAVAMNRTFFVYESELVQSQMLLEPNNIDWRPVSNCLSLHPDETLPKFGRDFENHLYLAINKLKLKQNVYISNFHRIVSLIDNIHRSSLKDSPIARALHTLSGGPEHHCLLSVLHQFLFKVSEDVGTASARVMEDLNLRPLKFISIHIRTGFMSTIGESVEPRYATTETSWRAMVSFALKMANKSFGNENLIYVASDDQKPKDWITRTYGLRIRTLNVRPVHVTRTITATDNEYFHNWIELSILAQSYSIVRTSGGFSDVASHMCSMNPKMYFTLWTKQNITNSLYPNYM